MRAASIPVKDHIRRLATGGVASVAFSVAITNLLRIFSSMTLTRLLDSTAYGVVGVITSVAYTLAMLSDVGLYDFIVRHEEGDEREFLDQVWTIRLIRSTMLAITMAVLAKPITLLLGKPELAVVVAVWSVSFVLDGLSSLAFATAVRHQKLWRLGTKELAANVATLIVSVVLAAIYHSYWALIGGMTAGAIVTATLSYILFPGSGRRFRFNRARSGELWSFSRYIAISSILSLLILMSDKFVLAKLMPLPVFGLYSIAVTLAAAPVGLATPYALRVLLSVYSKTALENRAVLRRVVYDSRRRVTLAYMAGVGVLIGTSPLIVEILYDPRYRGVAPYMRLLLISTALRLPSLSAKQALIAIGRTGAQLIGNVASIIWLIIGGVTGLVTGNVMLLVALVGTVEVPNLLCFWWSMRRYELLDWREEGLGLSAMAVGLTLGLVMNWLGLSLIAHL